MEKTKKLSKSSIAVIVLAILLALSMIMGITGAWFTDSDNGSGTNTELNFGKVNIDISGTAGSEIAITPDVVAQGKLQPGDGYSLEATVTNWADVQMYVFVATTTEFKVKVGDAAYGNAITELYNYGGNTNLLNVGKLAIDQAEVAEANRWTLVADNLSYTKDAVAYVGNLYLVPVSNETASFKATITLSQDTENVVYTSSSTQDNTTKVILNNVEENVTYGVQVTASLHVDAIQVAHIAGADANDAAKAAAAAMGYMGYTPAGI